MSNISVIQIMEDCGNLFLNIEISLQAALGIIQNNTVYLSKQIGQT